MSLEIVTAYRKSNALFAFVDSNAPLYLSTQDGKTVEQISQLCNVYQDRFHSLLDYMQTLNVLTKKEDKFYLTEQWASLSDPNSFETLYIKFELDPAFWSAWSQYSTSLSKTNEKSAFELTHHEPFFDYLSHEHNKTIKTIFDNFLAKMANEMDKHIIEHIPLNGISSFIDIGGGVGSFSKKIKMNYPHVQCHVFDQYDFTRLESEGVTFINGNFFSAIPSGYDAYSIKNVLDDWPDNQAIDILKNCHKAMRADSVLYVIDIIKGPNDAVSFDLYIDTILLGRRRYQSEFEFMAKQSGLSITNIYNLNFSTENGSYYIIEMKK
ncbi:methyltransferase [Xenorhabdus cabanillasii]|uniref:O-demethylpuromycin O-methyltransferase n=1 Tax=Xenorhabdus cabanillasii JM26 TaxID=1427517 RepID=W1J9S5_9GAMM|nr:methyltransferase [Xenorhabdus cabanillasii]PHM76626.1 phenazine-specific methyltransferase PhzM [Xenorhabdus cabanillasii JM26]CDL87449.1 putative O-demethylpuromycin O-methyltransferase [Xenorhabdus cabanillasii JM26]